MSEAGVWAEKDKKQEVDNSNVGHACLCKFSLLINLEIKT